MWRARSATRRRSNHEDSSWTPRTSSEIREGIALGVVDGVTTNPSLIAKEKRPFRPLVEEICAIVPGDVSLEVVATDFEGMVKEGEELAQIAPNAVVKCPLTKDGLKAVRYLSGKGIRVNQTLCFSATAGAAVGQGRRDLHQPVPRPPRRHRPRGHGPRARHLRHLPQLRLRHPGPGRLHPEPAARRRRGQGRAPTWPPCPSPSSSQLMKHPLTDIGLKRFLDDWAKSGAKI